MTSDRDTFAAAALNGLLSSRKDRMDLPSCEGGVEEFWEVMNEYRRNTALVAYAYADAMLKAREQ